MKISEIDLNYVDHFGDDLMVVNRARVSFSKKKDSFDESDIGLIRYLARGYTNKDWSAKLEEIRNAETIEEVERLVKEIRNAPTHFMPFAHPHVTFHLKVPVWLSRQLAKHQIGFSWSEESRRYIDSEPEIWFPKGYRARGENIKQGSKKDEFVEYLISDEEFGDETVFEAKEKCQEAIELYKRMLNSGVAPEHARTILPQNMMVEFDWTGSLMAWARLYNLRAGHGAQYEHEEITSKLDREMTGLFPHSWNALTK